MKRALLIAGLALLLVAPMAQGKVVNEHTQKHPGCDSISEELEITVRGGRRFATDFPGAVFTFDDGNRDIEIPACARVHVTFINEDDIRHQFMVHGTFPNGFFLLEVDGPGQDNGTFVVGPDPKTRMTHCGLPQHQQKGMKGQVRVAGGEGNVPNILGVSGIPEEDKLKDPDYTGSIASGAPTMGTVPTSTLVVSVGFIAVAAGWALWERRRRER